GLRADGRANAEPVATHGKRSRTGRGAEQSVGVHRRSPPSHRRRFFGGVDEQPGFVRDERHFAHLHAVHAENAVAPSATFGSAFLFFVGVVCPALLWLERLRLVVVLGG